MKRRKKAEVPALTLGSLFDGIGGFPLGGILNGIKPLWASEIESFPIEVTKVRFCDMEHVGDITKLKGADLPPVDIVTGGSPCQDLSVAGMRAGLAGARSGLFMEQVRVVKEMREADVLRGRTAQLVRPRYMVWENVPGAFSSAEGEDFRAVLEEICRVADGTLTVPRPDSRRWESAGAIVLGTQFSLAWRVLDAQYWAVAQRRRRIYLVADFGGVTAPQILFEQDRLFGNSAPFRGTGEATALSTEECAENTGGACLTPWDVQSRRIFSGDGTWSALYSGEGGGHGYIQAREKQLSAFHINQREEVIDLKGVSGALMATTNMQMQTFVARTPMLCLNDQGGNRMDVTEDVVTTLRSNMGGHPPLVSQPDCLNAWDAQQSRVFVPEGVAPTLAGADGGGGRNPGGLLFAAGFCAGAAPTAGGIGYEREVSPTLKAGESGTNMVPSILCLNDQGGKVMACSEEISGTLRAQEHGHQPLVMATQQGGAEMGTDICPAITAAAGMSGNNQPVLFENHGIDSRYTGPHPVAPTMSARYGTGGNNVPLVARGSGDDLCIAIAANIIGREPKNGGNGLGWQENIAYTLTRADQHAICEPYQDTVGALCRGDEKGVGNQYVSQDKCIVEEAKLIRRLTPLECERLQGFPDGWTAIPDASDSARYKALGNSVAIPCVDFVLRGIAYFLHRQ